MPFPFDYETSHDQADAKLSYFADDFLGGGHDFRFGVQYSRGSAETDVFAGFNGGYYYRYEYYPGYPYYYRYTFTPFRYGAEQESWAGFADDSWRVNDRLTLNLGVRYDRHTGWFPDYPRLDENGVPTGETIPGIDDVVDWTHVSPRLGFAWVATGDQKTVVRGSFLHEPHQKIDAVDLDGDLRHRTPGWTEDWNPTIPRGLGATPPTRRGSVTARPPAGVPG